MGLDQVITIGREAILTIISVAAPCLVISITTGSWYPYSGYHSNT